MADKNVVIKHKISESEVVNVYPKTKSELVDTSTTSSVITGNTLEDVLNNAIPLKAGTNITIGADGTISSNAIASIKGTSPIVVSGNTISINSASTSQKGAVQLSSSTSSDSETLAATAKAVKTVKDLVNTKQDKITNTTITVASQASDKSGVINITTAINQNNGQISGSGTSLSVYNTEQINKLIAGVTTYLGTYDGSAAFPLTKGSYGDFYRATNNVLQSTSGLSEYIHTGDLIILDSSAANAYSVAANWKIIHTGDNTSYSEVSNTAAGLTPQIRIGQGQISSRDVKVLVTSNNTSAKWQTLPENAFNDTTYTLSGDGTATVTLTPNGSEEGSRQSITINNVANATNATNATTANKVSHALEIKLNGGSPVTFDGSAAKSINITPGNISAATATHQHTVTLTGDATGTATSYNPSIAVTLKEVNPSAGTTGTVYSAVKVNNKGLAIQGAQVYKYYAAGTKDTDITGDSSLVNGGFAFVEI